MFPKLFTIPFLHESLHSYGVLIATGFVLCTQMIAREAKRLGHEPQKFTDLAFYLLLVGLLGSRILFLIVNWRDYAKAPIDMLFFWRGGLVFYGGFLAALVYAVWWSRRHKIGFFLIADLMIPMVAFNHAWGRLGCLAAGCCFGRVTMTGVGIRFPADSVVQQTQHAQGLIGLADFPYPVHATQAYEALGEASLFLLLVWFRPRKRFHGQLLLLWLALYPILRSVVESLRGDVERGFVVRGVLSTSQFISIFVVLLAATLFWKLRARAAVLLLALLLPVQAYAAQRVTQKSSMSGPPSMPKQEAQQQVMAWSKGRVRTDSGTQQSSIIDFKADKLIVLDHTRKQYTELSLPDLMAQMKAAMTQLRSQMSTLPPEQREQLESMLDPQPLELKAASEDSRLGSFVVKKYVIRQGGKETGEVHYTRDIDTSELAPYAKRLYDTMRGMGSGWAEVLARSEHGFPVKTVLTMRAMGQPVTYTTEVMSYDSPALDDAYFQVPKGYTKQEPSSQPAKK